MKKKKKNICYFQLYYNFFKKILNKFINIILYIFTKIKYNFNFVLFFIYNLIFFFIILLIIILIFF